MTIIRRAIPVPVARAVVELNEDNLRDVADWAEGTYQRNLFNQPYVLIHRLKGAMYGYAGQHWCIQHLDGTFAFLTNAEMERDYDVSESNPTTWPPSMETKDTKEQ